jgi:hypothetical protein
MPTRECPFCGKGVSRVLTQCPFCREALPPEVRVTHRRSTDPGREIRQGLLCALLAAVVGYFSGGYSALKLPFPIQPFVTTYFSPLLFLGGLALSFHGFYLQHKQSSHTTRSSKA